MKKKILLVDDNSLNRQILKKILESDYEIVEADNGKDALHVLGRQSESIAGIMLDIVMPVMDGFEFLKVISRNVSYKNIPVIVSTGNSEEQNEIKALEAGAWDFVSKPYKPQIIRFRLKNAIARSRIDALERLSYIAEYDVLTGIYNKEKFFEETQRMLSENRETEFACISFDIDRFQLVNSFFGMTEGDELLKYIGQILKKRSERCALMTYGRMEADIFAFCIVYPGREELEKQMDELILEIKSYALQFDIVTTCGIYVIEDKKASANTIYDCSRLAAKQIKGNYIKSYAFYSSDLIKKIEQEQWITNDMNQALKEEQFLVYLQPKYNIKNNALSGAEALVRWKHPESGMISPGVFIPIFEQNGFVTKLDYYIWEKVCALLHSWHVQGRDAYPVSVNVSRVNLYNPNLVDLLCQLVEKYEISPGLLQLELTESAYTDNPMVMKDTMKRLHEKGFVVLMDDFGSGYSSLNVLKDIPVDILKIDMKFFEKSDIQGRGENIVSSVVRMAKWLHIPTIAEGVEEKGQVDFLRSIGCEYVQGFYFARPMPVDAYEKLAKEEKVFCCTDAEEEDNTDSLLLLSPQIEKMFSDVMQAIGVYEYSDDELELIRVNNAFYELFGREDKALHGDALLDVVEGEYQPVLMEAFQKASRQKGMAECDYQRILSDGRVIWIHIKIKYISQVGIKSILIGSLFDVTEQKKVEIELNQYRAAIIQRDRHYGKILIVDDEEVNRVVLGMIFEADYQVLEAENGKQALDILKKEENCIDIIFLDLSMPVMDGIEFLKYKQKENNIEHIPVIIITADDASQQQVKAIALGASDYVLKPFVKETVLRRTQNVLESRKNFSKRVKAVGQE